MLDIKMIEVENIRKTNKNLKKIRDLNAICFPNESSPLFSSKKHKCWIVYYEDEVAGFASGYKWKNFFYLARGGVLPKYRGKKIQQFLINKRIEMAKSMNLDAVIAYTSIDNIASIKNLKACGFQQWANAPKCFRRYNHSECVEWKLDLVNTTRLCPDFIEQ